MSSSLAFTVFLALFAVAVQAQSLLDALANANASGFAQFLQSNPSFLAALQAPGVQTIFAPTDDAVNAFTSNASSPSLSARQALNFQAQYQASSQLQSLASMGNPPGAVVPSNLKTGSRNQAAVSQPSKASNSSGVQRRQQAANSSVQLFTGLGNTANIVKGDTHFSGGLIQTVDSFFTIPQSFASTFNQTGLTSFGNGLQSANLSSAANSPNGVTIFSVANDVFQSGLGNSTSAQLSSALANHVIPNFLGFLPVLTNGQTLTTQAGTQLTVSIRNGNYYINNAKIITPNLITETGVSHILDQLINPYPIAISGGSGLRLDATTFLWPVAALFLLTLT